MHSSLVATDWPKPQADNRVTCVSIFSNRGKSLAVASFRLNLLNNSKILVVPNRQGVHLPQDS